MIFFYFALFFLCFLKNDNIKLFSTDDYLSRNTTDSVKGLFIILVFFSHLKSYVSYSASFDVMGGKVSSILGQLIVTMFLFYSGYGVCEAIKKKGWEYIKPFPKNRVLKTLLHFDLAVLLFILLNVILGKKMSIKDIALSLICWRSIGNSNWYIFAVISLYILTYIAFMIFKKQKVLAACLLTLLTFGYIFAVKEYQSTWWYDTVLCYPLGIFYSLAKDKIEKFLTKSNIVYFIILGIVGAALLFCHTKRSDIVFAVCRNTLFPLAFVLASLKFPIQNDILKWLGAHTFEIFILQRIPMIIFDKLKIDEMNLYIYVIISLTATLLLTVIFRKLTNCIDKVLFKTSAKPSQVTT